MRAASASVLIVGVLIATLYVSEGVLRHLPNEAVAGLILAGSLFAYPIVTAFRRASDDR